MSGLLFGGAGRTRVKICGVTNRADAETAVELGADALGFNLFPGSKRHIILDKEAGWIAELPVTKVAVMVNPTLGEIESAMGAVDIIQLHGAEDGPFCALVAGRGVPFVKAVALRDGLDIGGFRDAGAILLDTYTKSGFGGTGELLDLEMAKKFAALHRDIRLIISGGLRPENVAGVVRALRPYAVDVASGVESEPRRKDRKLLAGFLEAVRAAE